MHVNAIHDLALAFWSELLSPIKRAAIQTNLACTGKLSAIGFGIARYSLRRHFRIRFAFVVLRDRCCRALKIRTTGMTEGEE